LLCVAAPFLGCFQTTHQMFSAIVPGGTARPSGMRERNSNSEVKSAWASEEKVIGDDTNQQRMFSRFAQLSKVRKDSVLESVKHRIFRADRVRLTCANELAAGASDAAGKRENAPHRQPCLCDVCCPQRDEWKSQGGEPRKRAERRAEALHKVSPQVSPQAAFHSAFDRMDPFGEAAGMDLPQSGYSSAQLSQNSFKDIFADELVDGLCRDDDDEPDDDALEGRDMSRPNGVTGRMATTTSGRSSSWGGRTGPSSAVFVAGRAARFCWS